ncbi:T9SS type A sorting domain-containing protein [Flavobacterium sp. SM2513]|uniref:T9SS type A sorting domain-containing protein n=1 Tax=Flavobacterium sp. SM2513 TaxID=3424766 RepID=UPI003D7FB4D2
MKNKKLLAALLLLASSGTLLAQVKNTGILYVQNGTELYVNESFDFGTQTQTSRAVSNGVLSLSAVALNTSTASNLNFVDGFVKIYPTVEPAFYKIPLGFGTAYGPIGVLASNSQAIISAYYVGNPDAIGTTLDIEVDNISASEYWSLASSNTGKVTMYWSDDSDLDAILGIKPVDYLTVLGYDGAKWIALNSEVNPILESITTTQDVNLATYSNYAIGSRKDIACYTPITSSEIIKTWNGTSWSPSAPGITDPIVIDGPLTVASHLECYSVTLNNDVTLTDGKKLTVVNGFVGTGKIIMSNLASVIQQNPTADAPKIQMTKIAEQMRRYDYVYLGNPINDAESFFTQILNKENVATNDDFDVQANAAFLQLRTFNLAGVAAINATAVNTPIGRGFSATVRSQAPYSTSNAEEAWYIQKEDIHVKIEGITNNGSYAMTLPETGGYMRLGNPYPSPINGQKFWELADGFVDKTLYYWTYHTARGSLSANSYNNADFATYNQSGGTAAFDGGTIPDGTILPMESVLLQSVASSVTITMDNCVRFFDAPLPKAINTTTTNGKFRLNLQGSQNSFSQILIAYDDTKGTLGYDNGYDSQRPSGSSSELSSLIENARFTIQTRSAFTIEDIVPLLLDKRTDESFTISLATTEGIFETTPVFLHDKMLDIYHNLSVNNYSFTQTAEASAFRFDVVYEGNVLNNTDFKIETISAFIHNNEFRATANTSISEIQIYDITGRLIVTYTDLATESFSSNFDKPQGIYIAKIKLANGTVATQKLINL